MPKRNIIVIGGSAGSGEPLREILKSIPDDLDAAIFIAVHRASIGGIDYLPSSLGRLLCRNIVVPCHEQTFKAGCVYVAPADTYLLVGETTVSIASNPSNAHRNGINALFQSAAIHHGTSVIGVLLSGMLADGTAGFWHIRKYGGITIAQDPAEAAHSSMPQSAMRDAPVNYCLRASEIAPKLRELVCGSSPEPAFKSGRVMIVEHQWCSVPDLNEQLTDLGYVVVATLESGEEALSLAPSLLPDIAIMDVRLAGKMKGTEAATRLRERFQIPTIFLTAYTDLATLSAADASRPYAFLTKPCCITELNSAIQLALGDCGERSQALLSCGEYSPKL